MMLTTVDEREWCRGIGNWHDLYIAFGHKNSIVAQWLAHWAHNPGVLGSKPSNAIGSGKFLPYSFRVQNVHDLISHEAFIVHGDVNWWLACFIWKRSIVHLLMTSMDWLRTIFTTWRTYYGWTDKFVRWHLELQCTVGGRIFHFYRYVPFERGATKPEIFCFSECCEWSLFSENIFWFYKNALQNKALFSDYVKYVWKTYYYVPAIGYTWNARSDITKIEVSCTSRVCGKNA